MDSGAKAGRGYRGHAKGLYLYSLGLKQSWRDQHGQKWPWWLEKGGRRVAMGEYESCFIDLFPSPNPCRAILVRRDEIRVLSSEFTPETERQRIQQLVGTLGRGTPQLPGLRPTRGSGKGS